MHVWGDYFHMFAYTSLFFFLNTHNEIKKLLMLWELPVRWLILTVKPTIKKVGFSYWTEITMITYYCADVVRSDWIM